MDINVGDTVEVLSDRPLGSYFKKGDKFVVTNVKRVTGEYQEYVSIYGTMPGQPFENCVLAKHVRKVPPVIDDDVIRVGDTVKRTHPNRSSDYPSYRGLPIVVTKVGNRLLHFGKDDSGRYDDNGDPENYTKVKSGSDSTPATTNTHTHEQVSGQVEGEGIEHGKGEAVRARRCTGQIAVGSQLAGNAVTARVGKGALGGAEIRPAALRSAHL